MIYLYVKYKIMYNQKRVGHHILIYKKNANNASIFLYFVLTRVKPIFIRINKWQNVLISHERDLTSKWVFIKGVLSRGIPFTKRLVMKVTHLNCFAQGALTQ